jgi:prevent-host-death family protein
MCYLSQMTIWRVLMTTSAVSVTEFKAHCLDVIRQVEQDGTAVDLTRHGKVVARLVPTPRMIQSVAPWLRLRGRGRLSGAPEMSVLDSADFDALR